MYALSDHLLHFRTRDQLCPSVFSEIVVSLNILLEEPRKRWVCPVAGTRRHSSRSHVDNHSLHTHGLRCFLRHDRRSWAHFVRTVPLKHMPTMWLPVHMVAPITCPFSCSHSGIVPPHTVSGLACVAHSSRKRYRGFGLALSRITCSGRSWLPC